MLTIEDKISLIIEECEKKKAFDIKTIDVSESSSIADYFIIASGNSANQVMAISEAVEEAVSEYEELNGVKEGYRAGRWVVLDYIDVVVHVFHKDEREFYNLERLWEEEK